MSLANWREEAIAMVIIPNRPPCYQTVRRHPRALVKKIMAEPNTPFITSKLAHLPTPKVSICGKKQNLADGGAFVDNMASLIAMGSLG